MKPATKLCKALVFVLASSALLHGQQTSAPAKSATEGPANSGRKQLTDYLNSIAAAQTAARREVIARITTRAQAEARQRHVRDTILKLIGTLPERIRLNPRTTGSTPQDGFRVDKVIFDSQPNFPVTALLYVPTFSGGAPKFPAIVMAPGHSPAGKAGDVAFASAFARAGFIVLSYDPIGQGERLQYLDPASTPDKPTSLATRPTGEHGEAGLQPTLIGDALARYFLWDGMRAVDYLSSLPEVDPRRIGAFGCSGGGTMTALLGALDTRVAAMGVACYTTSFDALLASSTGVQDSEQSTPNFIASGLDFPDWAELAAPRPYAIIATTADMFPFAGAQTTEAEARRFYKLFAADKSLAFITGPGGHGNLRPILPQILRFFTDHLHPDPVYAKNLPPLTDPSHTATLTDRPAPPPHSLTQVTPTGQLSSSYPGTATVFSLNRARYDSIVAHASSTTKSKSLAALQLAVRTVTHASATPHGNSHAVYPAADTLSSGGVTYSHVVFEPEAGIQISAKLGVPDKPGRHPARLLLGPLVLSAQDKVTPTESALSVLAEQGTVAMATELRPSPQGAEETKSPVLGPFYLTELRAELVGKTLLGMRIDDVIRAVDYLASRPDVDPANLTAEASGHLGLVLLHAAILDPRIKHITIVGALSSYRGLVETPLPLDAPQDILPGVLLHYDIPDLVRALGSRVTWSSPAH